MLDPKSVAESVQTMLHDYCRQKLTDAEKIDPNYADMWREIDAYLAGGGKRLRPYLVILAYEAFGGEDSKSIMSIASAWELLHACLLVHDDIIDRDTMRHGYLNISGKYQEKYRKLTRQDADHYALSTALLAGDLLLSASYDMVSTSSLQSEHKLFVQSCLQSAMFAVGGGEFLDSASALYPIQHVSPLVIAEYKTATYSFQLPLICGATIAGASYEDIEKVRIIGLDTGVAFQLQDDLLGVFGEEAQTGKSNRSDIYEKKRTLLLQLTREHLDSEQTKRLDEICDTNHTVTEREADELLGLIKKSGAAKAVESLIAEHVERAIVLTRELAINTDYQELLIDLIKRAGTRTT